MTYAYDLGAWHGFFEAMLGTTGGIFGLMIVAFSVRADSISSHSRLVALSAEGPIMTFSMFLAIVLALMPGQRRVAFGLEFILLTVATGVVLIWIPTRHRLWQLLLKETPFTSILMAASGIPLILGGIGLMTHSLGGLVVLMVGYLGLLTSSVLIVWALLIHDPHMLLAQLEGKIESDLEAKLGSKVTPEVLAEINATVEDSMNDAFEGRT